MALAQEEPPGHPAVRAIRKRQAVHEKVVAVEGHRQHGAAVGVVANERERVPLSVAEQNGSVGSRSRRKVRIRLGKRERIGAVHVAKRLDTCARQRRRDRRSGRVYGAGNGTVAVVRRRIHVSHDRADLELRLVVPQSLPLRGVQRAGPGRAIQVREGTGREKDALVVAVGVSVGEQARHEPARRRGCGVERIRHADVVRRLANPGQHRLCSVSGDDEHLGIEPGRCGGELRRSGCRGCVGGEHLGPGRKGRQGRQRQR